jgi:hypothetical protein
MFANHEPMKPGVHGVCGIGGGGDELHALGEVRPSSMITPAQLPTSTAWWCMKKLKLF